MKTIPGTLQPLFDAGFLWQGQTKTKSHHIKTGFQRLDNILVSGGWPTRCVIEILTNNPVHLPTQIILPSWRLLSENKHNWLGLINPPYQPCTEGWMQKGVNTSKIDIVSVNKNLFVWCTEQFCQSNTTTSVLAWAPEKINFSQLRRLQLACQKYTTQLFLVRPIEYENNPSPASLRLKLLQKNQFIEVFLLKQLGSLTEYNVNIRKNFQTKEPYKSISKYKIAYQLINNTFQ